MTNFDEFLKEQLENEEVKKEYDVLAPEFALIQSLINARRIAGLNQALTVKK